jgi:hypothetical protein
MYPKKQDGPLELVGNLYPEKPPIDDRGLMPLRYTGAAFLLIQRSVFERMKQDKTIDEYRSDYSGRVEHDFGRPGVYKGRYLPEDFFFCQRARDLGFKVWADSRVRLQHIGNVSLPLQSQWPNP